MEVLLDTCGRQRVKPLLLLYLFVVKAAADCPKPQGWENIVLTNEALLLNDFPDGSTVTLECANGYVRESGAGVTNCVDGNWTQPDLICKKRDCGYPKPQPHMSFNTSAGTLFGAIIRVICDEGYQVSGSSYKQCYATGWTGRARCEIITCDTPGTVANGISTWDSQEHPKYGEIVHYFCDVGHTLVGKDHIVCGETGEYDSEPPECKGVSTDNGTVMKASTPPAQEFTEASTSTDSPATTTKAHTDKTHTASEAPPTTTPSARGGADIMAAGDKTTTASETSTSFQDKYDGAVDTNKDNGYVPVIVSVICVSIVVCVIVLFLHKYLLRRKGSYDTREDLKPELLQFQNL